MEKAEIVLDLLGPISPAAELRSQLGAVAWSGVATYLLWSLIDERPVYCGTAKSPRRIIDHLDKDDLLNAPLKKTRVNMPLRQYCLAQTPGWLGIAYRVFSTADEAKVMERSIIARFGIVKKGGVLFNQRMSG
jgi:hypothetical protein